MFLRANRLVTEASNFWLLSCFTQATFGSDLAARPKRYENVFEVKIFLRVIRDSNFWLRFSVLLLAPISSRSHVQICGPLRGLAQIFRSCVQPFASLSSCAQPGSKNHAETIVKNDANQHINELICMERPLANDSVWQP